MACPSSFGSLHGVTGPRNRPAPGEHGDGEIGGVNEGGHLSTNLPLRTT